MINIKSFIEDELNTLSIPVTQFKPLSGTKLPCIVYYVLGNQEYLREFDDISIQINLMSNKITDIDTKSIELNNIMTSIGFRRDFATEIYDEKTKMYQKVFRYVGVISNDLKVYNK